MPKIDAMSLNFCWDIFNTAKLFFFKCSRLAEYQCHQRNIKNMSCILNKTICLK